METFFTGIGKTLGWIVNWLWLPAEAIMNHWFMASTDNTTEILLNTESTPESPSAPTSAYTPPTAPIPAETITTSSGSKKPTIADFCLAIAAYEGGPGDASHRNNNPGNVRYNPSGYMPMYGVVKCSPAGFAIFKDWNTGMLYLNNMVRGMVHKRPNETILQFMSRYAPVSENDPTAYATFIAKRLGVDISTKMSALV